MSARSDATPRPIALVRAARPEDGRAMAEVHVAAWRAAYAGIMSDGFLGGLNEDTSARRWAATLAGPHPSVSYLVAESDGRVVGIGAAGAPRQEVPDGVGELWMINLHPRWWRRGLGTLLHDGLMAELAAFGYLSAYLWVAQGNDRARAFYRAKDWRPDGERRVDDRAEPPIPELRYVRDPLVAEPVR
jgi:ribosomal protein S18 acetylase RimI-like enzyme